MQKDACDDLLVLQNVEENVSFEAWHQVMEDDLVQLSTPQNKKYQVGTWNTRTLPEAEEANLQDETMQEQFARLLLEENVLRTQDTRTVQDLQHPKSPTQDRPASTGNTDRVTNGLWNGRPCSPNVPDVLVDAVSIIRFTILVLCSKVYVVKVYVVFS